MMKVYTVRDTAVHAFMTPFFAQADGAAIRSFIDAINDQKHEFNRHYTDYELYVCGTFDPASGLIDASIPVRLISGSEALIKDLSPR